MRRCLVISVNTTWNLLNFRAGLISALLADGWRVVCLAPDDRHAERVRALGCELIDLPMDNDGTHPLRDLALCWRYWRLFRRLRPAAYLGYTVKPNVYGSLAAHALGIPVINNIAGLGTAFLRGGWLLAVVRLLYKAALWRSRTVFFQNADDKALFLEHGMVDERQVALLPGSGIDLEHFSPRPRESRSGEPRVFLLVARLLWDKGVGEFVEAIRILRQSGVHVEARLLGFLDARNPTAVPSSRVDEWQAEGLITYCGKTDDVRDAISEADVVVLPSYREGTPRSLLEAAAMGKPLIATDVPGCREVVVHESNGLLVQAKNASHLAAAIQHLAGLPDEALEQLGASSRRLAEQKFDVKVVVDRYRSALRTLTSGQRLRH